MLKPETINRIVKTALVLGVVSFIGIALAGSHRKPRWGWLGVRIERLDKQDKKDLNVTFGVKVTEVLEKSPAEKAGIKKDDIIREYDGDKVRKPEDLTWYVQTTEPGTKVQLKIRRDSKDMDIPVTIEKNRKNRGFAFGPHAFMYSFNVNRPWLGVQLHDLSADLAPYFQSAADGGALILEVEEDSPAEKAGLKAGDVIVELDQEKIECPEDVTGILEDFEAGEEVSLQVLRKGQKLTFKAELDERKGFGRLETIGEFDEKVIRIPEIHVDVPELDSLQVEKLRGVEEKLKDMQLKLQTEKFRDMEEKLKDMELKIKMEAGKGPVVST
ncbi:PDZ domain-containing protein [bacterium]|nr:PDZ domain-containing protein [bacterium]